MLAIKKAVDVESYHDEQSDERDLVIIDEKVTELTVTYPLEPVIAPK